MLSEHKPLYIIMSFVHPREITDEVRKGIARMADAGLVLLQQGKGADMGAAFGGGSDWKIWGQHDHHPISPKSRCLATLQKKKQE